MGYGFAHGRRGSPTIHPCIRGELVHFLCATLRAIPSSARRVRGVPFGAHPVRVARQGTLVALAANEAMDGRSSKQSTRRCTAPSIAAPSGSKARMFEHKDVRLNRQGLPI